MNNECIKFLCEKAGYDFEKQRIYPNDKNNNNRYEITLEILIKAVFAINREGNHSININAR